LVLGTILFGFYLFFPSLYSFTTGKRIPKVVKEGDPWFYHVFPAETLKLGLDLKGGLYLALGLDFDEVNRNAMSRMKVQLEEQARQDKITDVQIAVTTDNRLEVTTASADAAQKLDDLVGREFGEMLDPDGSRTGNVSRYRFTASWESQVRSQAIEQSLETLRNRIDEFGVAEPIIQRRGEEKILVQFPGVQEPGRLKEIIARTAKLSFQIERSGPEEPGGSPSPAQLQAWIDEFVKAKSLKLDNENTIAMHTRELNAFLESRLPKGTEILFQRKMNVNTREATYTPYLLDREALVTGEDLQDAYVTFNNERGGEPMVAFQLTPVGGEKFAKATGANVGKHMAIVLDNNVHSAPTIQERIGSNGVINFAGAGRDRDEVYNDAKDTALVLRSGALPARLHFLEERVVGPSLGEDAIRMGRLSFLVGTSVVFLFLILYYKASGFVALLALCMNFLFILGGMSAFEGTLTLPGLAGMVLGLGMSVDSNVLIFEYMRDEIRAGKPLRTALAEAYAGASSAIWDANITAILSGVVLLSFGYGPIRGFAVTLLLGLVSSVFTAVFVTRVVFDYLIVVRNAQRISL
jgi:preprotein translocase subunit SecD